MDRFYCGPCSQLRKRTLFWTTPLSALICIDLLCKRNHTNIRQSSRLDLPLPRYVRSRFLKDAVIRFVSEIASKPASRRHAPQGDQPAPASSGAPAPMSWDCLVVSRTRLASLSRSANHCASIAILLGHARDAKGIFERFDSSLQGASSHRMKSRDVIVRLDITLQQLTANNSIRGTGLYAVPGTRSIVRGKRPIAP